MKHLLLGRAITAGALVAGALATIAAPAPPVTAATGCFTVEVTNDLRMDVAELDEASGLVLSRQMPGVMWTHNDHDPTATNAENNRIYAVNEEGDLLATVQFTMSPSVPTVPDATFFELEDISFGPGPDGDPDYLYLADTGDNPPASRSFASVYRFAEPVFAPDPANPITIQIHETQLDGTRFEYQSFIDPGETKPRNVEGVFVDPATGHLFLVEKGLHAIDVNGELADGTELPREYAYIYRIAAKQLFPPNPATLRLATVEGYVKAEFGAGAVGVTAADMAADGTIIAMKNRDETFYWHRDPNETVLATLNRDPIAPCQAPTGMKGEGLAVGPISGRLVMIREGLLSPIWQAVFTDQTYECFGRAATIVGTAGDDVITGTPGNDVIVTFGGDDTVLAKKGFDRICLGPGNDAADGGLQRDRIDGGWGDDILEGSYGRDLLWGRDGWDVLAGNAHDDVIYGGDGQDTITGGGGIDTILGMNGADSISGQADGDVLKGGRGADDIGGGNGNDALTGGAGTDTCDGGDGVDTAQTCELVRGVP